MTPRTPAWRTRRALVATTALALALTACGSDSDADSDPAAADGTSTSDGDFPTTVVSGDPSDGTELTIEDKPESIVSLSPTSTEILWAIGAGDQVVAVDDQSNYPEDVPTTQLSGHQPNLEAILGYEPDLVVAAGDTNDIVAGLEAAAVPTLLMPAAADLDEAYSQMERLGTATGNADQADDVVADVQERVDAATAQASGVEGATYFHELDPGLYTVTSETFIGQLYAEFGLTNIADEANAGDYPQIASEFVVTANPDIITLADTTYTDVTADSIADRPGWSDISAIQNGNVVELDDDIASRWGPRVADFAEAIGEQVATLETSSAG